MAIIAFITVPDEVRRVLAHIGEPARAPPVAPARVRGGWEDAQQAMLADPEDWAQPMPEYNFDQRMGW